MKQLLIFSLLVLGFVSCDSSNDPDSPVEAVYELAEYNESGVLKSLSNIGAGKRIDVNKGIRFMEMYSMDVILPILKQIPYGTDGLDPRYHTVTEEPRTIYYDEHLQSVSRLGGGYEILYAANEREMSEMMTFFQNDSVKSKLPLDLIWMWSFNRSEMRRLPSGEKPFVLYAIKKDCSVPMNGFDLAKASQGTDQSMGRIVIDLKLTRDGAEKFKELSSNNVNRCLAIALGDRVCSAPNVIQAITGGNIQISGTFSNAEADDLIQKINSFVRSGTCEMYHPNGKIKQKRFFVNGESSGPWSLYDEHGKLIREYKQ